MGILSSAWNGIKSLHESINPLYKIAKKGVDLISGREASQDSIKAAQTQLESEQAFNAEQAQINRDFQREERLQTQEFNLDMWNLNNEYNSPVEQLKRAQAAGINPNAVIGDSGYKSATSSPVTSSAMSGATAAASPSIANSLLTSDAVVQNLLAQTKNIESQTDLNEYQLSWNKLSEADRLKELKANGDKILSDIGMNDFSKDLQERTFTYFARKSEKELEVMNQQVNLLYNQSREILKNIDLKDAQIDKTYAEVHSIDLDNEVKEMKNQLSQAIGIPIDTPEYNLMYTLYAQGKFEEFTNASMISASRNSQLYQETSGVAAAVMPVVDSIKQGIMSLFGNENQQAPSYKSPTKH